MRSKWWMAMLMVLQEAWSTRRDAHIRFLKVQVEMLKVSSWTNASETPPHSNVATLA
jgi:hypothetical protein